MHGIDISWVRPWLLDTEAKVKIANRIRKKIGGDLLKTAWKLGDHCWYRKKEK